MAVIKRALLIVAVCTAFTACSDDPRQGGFISGAYNLTTGGYDKRIAREQAALDEEKAHQSALQTRAEQVRRQRQELDAELDQLRKEMTAVDAQLRRLRADTATTRDLAQRGRLQEAALRLAATRKKVEATAWQDQPADEALKRLRELKAEANDIAAVADAAR